MCPPENKHPEHYDSEHSHSHEHEHNHEHSHGDGHGHGHSHSHVPTGRGPLIAVLAITATVLIAEVIGALWSGSLALFTDAGHMLVDSSGLVIALVAAQLMRRPRSDTHTWGYRRSEVIAAAMQAGMLLVICVTVLIEGVHRLFAPEPVQSKIMLIFAVVGLVGNLIGMAVLFGSRRENLNLKAAFLEVTADTLGSVLVLVAAGVTLLTGWEGADAVASLAIAAIMAPRAVHLLRASLRILMAATPEGLDLAEVRRHILEVEHVIDCHDLHVSTIGTGVVMLAAHVTVEDKCLRDGHAQQIVHHLQECVAEHFPVKVGHSTFQLDSATHRDHEILHH